MCEREPQLKNFSSPAARALVTFQVCGVLSGWSASEWMEACVRLFPSSREPADSGIALAARGPQLTSYLPKNPSGRLWLECRPELRNQSVGWARAVERLRNGGVPRNPVFLMPATHCILPSVQEVLTGRGPQTRPEVLTARARSSRGGDRSGPHTEEARVSGLRGVVYVCPLPLPPSLRLATAVTVELLQRTLLEQR